MELTFYEKYVLLTINDEKGTISYGYAKTHGFAGALIMELSNHNLIELVDKKLIIKNDQCDDVLLTEALQILSSKKKPQKINSALQYLSAKIYKSFDKVIDGLIAKGILKREEKKVLWVFNVNHFPTQNAAPENQIKSALKGIVLYGNHPDMENIQLLSLIDALGLHKEIFAKDDIKKAKKRIKEIIKNDQIGNSIHNIIQQEIMAAVAISVATTTVVTSN